MKKLVNISLTSMYKNILSEYNYSLTQHIELFEVTTKPTFSQYSLNINLITLPMSKYGIRCEYYIDIKSISLPLHSFQFQLSRSHQV